MGVRLVSMQEKTYLVLAQYRQGSEYADEVGRRYHFPRKYFQLHDFV